MIWNVYFQFTTGSVYCHVIHKISVWKMLTIFLKNIYFSSPKNQRDSCFIILKKYTKFDVHWGNFFLNLAHKLKVTHIQTHAAVLYPLRNKLPEGIINICWSDYTHKERNLRKKGILINVLHSWLISDETKLSLFISRWKRLIS